MHVLVAIPVAIFLIMIMAAIACVIMFIGISAFWCYEWCVIYFGLWPVIGGLVLISSGIVYAAIRIRRRWKLKNEEH